MLSEQDSTSVLNQEPNNVKALYRRAVALEAQQRGEEALNDLNKVLSLSADNVLAQELHSAISKRLAAERSVPPVPVPSLAPAAGREVTIDVQKLRQKAQQLLGDGLNDKVISLLAGHLRSVDEPPFSDLLQSDQTSLLHLLATAYSSTEDYAHAVAVQATILQIDPSNARALFKRAEGQLQLAAQASGEARSAALALAEQDIEAAVTARSGGTEVLALRQKLLRLRNTAPDPPVASSPAKASTPPSATTATPAADGVAQSVLASSPSKLSSNSSRQQSDAQKELGNKAMTEKNFSTAVMHYSNAIKFDESNLAAFNNRALAHLKLHAYAQAEADATVVIGQEDGAELSSGASNGTVEGVEALRLKALCRRAQARRAIGEAFISQQSPSAARTESALPEGQSMLSKALQDLQKLLKLDPSNKTALVEQKLSKDALKRCTDLLAAPLSVSATKAAPSVKSTVAPASPEPSPSPSTSSAGAKPPRADMGRVSAMFGSPSTSSSSSSAPSTPSAFGGLGMVARSSKKLSGATSTSEGDSGVSSGYVGSSPPIAQTAAASTPAKAAPTPTASKKAGSSPTPQVVLNAAPSEPPKTVYE